MVSRINKPNTHSLVNVNCLVGIIEIITLSSIKHLKSTKELIPPFFRHPYRRSNCRIFEFTTPFSFFDKPIKCAVVVVRKKKKKGKKKQVKISPACRAEAMGENSIINIPESRVNDWESERLSVVDDLSVALKQRECIIARIAIDCRRINIEPVEKFVTSEILRLREDIAIAENSEEGEIKGLGKSDFDRIDKSAGRNNDRTVFISRERGKIIGRGEEAEEELKREKKEKKKVESKIENTENKEQETKRLKKYRKVTSRSRVFLSSTSSSCPRLIQRIFLLFLSLLGIPFPSPFFSSQQFSSTGSRGPVLVSGSFFALVSLLVVVLLHPTMAIPTVAAVASDSSASGGTSTATPNPPLNETISTLARIIQRSKSPVVIVANEKKEASGDGVMNFESLPTTMPIRRRRNVEHASRQLSNDEEEEDEDDEQDEEDAFPALLIPHTWESAHEMRSQLREAELDTIRRSIVEGLGLERIPDPSKANVSQAEYRRAHQEYLTRLQHSRDSDDGSQRRLHTFHPAERNSTTTSVNRARRSITNELDRVHEEISSSKQNSVYNFEVAIPEDNSLLDHANLRLLLDLTDIPIEISKHVISLYRVAAATNSREFISRRSFANYENNGPRWIELDATELINRLLEENTKNFSVEIIVESIETGRSLEENEKKPIVDHPALNIFTMNDPSNEDFRGVRRKRRANPEHLMSIHKGRRTECRGENKKCCRHEMTVTFKDLKGFEFIVQPKNFDAGYCKGRCPPRYNPAHHHALLQSLIWKEDRRKAPRPCCAPSKLEELEILYFDENDPTKLKISSWKNMKVLECACS